MTGAWGVYKDEADCVQTLAAAHKRVKTRRGMAHEHDCVDCGEQARDWSRRHEETGMRSDHYDPRCRSCHQKYDYTDERRAKIGEANKRRDPNEKRPPLSPEHKAALAEGRRRAKAARDGE